MRDEYDVIVVGAGPAGLASAKSAKESGLSVLLLEDHPAIGVPVQCGESLIFSAFEDMGVEPDESWTYFGVSRVKLYSPGGRLVDVEIMDKSGKYVAIMERKVFEKKAAVKLAGMGVDVFASTPAVGVVKEGDKVCGIKAEHIGEPVEVRSSVVIAADGPASNVARWAGLPVKRGIGDFDSCAQFQMANVDIDPHCAEIYFGDVAPGAGLWLLPKGEGFANIGLGIFATEQTRALDYLKRFVANDPRLKDGSIIEVNAGPVPMEGVIERLYGDGILVVGDAAGQVNPFTGGGMRFGITAGLRAGRVAAKAIEMGDVSGYVLSDYQDFWKKEFGRRFKGFLAFKEWFLNAPPGEVETLFEDIGRVELPALDSRRDIASIALKKMLPLLKRHPRLVAKLGKKALF